MRKCDFVSGHRNHTKASKTRNWNFYAGLEPSTAYFKVLISSIIVLCIPIPTTSSICGVIILQEADEICHSGWSPNKLYYEINVSWQLIRFRSANMFQFNAMKVGNVVGAYNGDFNSCSIIKLKSFILAFLCSLYSTRLAEEVGLIWFELQTSGTRSDCSAIWAQSFTAQTDHESETRECSIISVWLLSCLTSLELKLSTDLLVWLNPTQ